MFQYSIKSFLNKNILKISQKYSRNTTEIFLNSNISEKFQKYSKNTTEIFHQKFHQQKYSKKYYRNIPKKNIPKIFHQKFLQQKSSLCPWVPHLTLKGTFNFSKMGKRSCIKLIKLWIIWKFQEQIRFQIRVIFHQNIS